MNSWFKTLASTCAIIPFAQCALIPGGNDSLLLAASPAGTVSGLTAYAIMADGETPDAGIAALRAEAERIVNIADTVADLTMAERDVGQLNQGYLSALPQAVGKKLTRALMPDQVLAPQHVEHAELIRRGDQVVITARSGGINVRMPGEALSDGALGRQISVRNQRSQRVVKARVTGPGQVEVAM